MKALMLFFDRRDLEIGRSDADGNFHPAQPGQSAEAVPLGDIPHTNWVKLAGYDWEYVVHMSHGNLDWAAERFEEEIERAGIYI